MTLSPRQRTLAAVGAVAGACAIAVPAALGLSHNPSFSQRIPVQVPSSAQLLSFDHRGLAVETIHHRHRSPQHRVPRHDDNRSTAASTREPEPGDDRGHHRAGDRGHDRRDDRGHHRGGDRGDDRQHHRSHHRGGDH